MVERLLRILGFSVLVLYFFGMMFVANKYHKEFAQLMYPNDFPSCTTSTNSTTYHETKD